MFCFFLVFFVQKKKPHFMSSSFLIRNNNNNLFMWNCDYISKPASVALYLYVKNVCLTKSRWDLQIKLKKAYLLYLCCCLRSSSFWILTQLWLSRGSFLRKSLAGLTRTRSFISSSSYPPPIRKQPSNLRRKFKIEGTRIIINSSSLLRFTQDSPPSQSKSKR